MEYSRTSPQRPPGRCAGVVVVERLKQGECIRRTNKSSRCGEVAVSKGRGWKQERRPGIHGCVTKLDGWQTEVVAPVPFGRESRRRRRVKSLNKWYCVDPSITHTRSASWFDGEYAPQLQKHWLYFITAWLKNLRMVLWSNSSIGQNLQILLNWNFCQRNSSIKMSYFGQHSINK